VKKYRRTLTFLSLLTAMSLVVLIWWHNKSTYPFAFINQPYVTELSWKPDGTLLVSASPPQIKIWNTNTWEVAAVCEYEYQGEVSSIAWHPNNNVLASVGWDEKLQLCDSNTGKMLGLHVISPKASREVIWDLQGNRIANADGISSGEMQIWDSTTWSLINSFTQGNGISTWSRDGNYVATATAGGTIEILSVTEPEPIFTRMPNAYPLVAWNRDQSMIAVSSDNVLYLWDVSTKSLLAVFSDNPSRIVEILWGDEGEKLATLDEDGTISLWSAKEMELIDTLVAPDNMDFSGIIRWGLKDRLLAVGAGPSAELLMWDFNWFLPANTIMLWETDTGQHIRNLNHPHPVETIAWSPNGDSLASGTIEGISIWRLEDIVKS
jgi:WD40 repeat protein